MDRTLDSQEKEKVRTARSNFFQNLIPKSSGLLSPRPNPLLSVAYTDTEAQPHIISSNKRFKTFVMPFSRSFGSGSGSGSKIPLIIRFYDPDTPPHLAKDAYDRTLEDILSWEDIQLERSHNYIQMLFPLPEGSMFNWEAPIITREIMETFRSRSELRNRLRMSFERMIDFYGFKISIKPEEYVEEEEDESQTGETANPAAQSLIQQEPGTEQPISSSISAAEVGSQQPTETLASTDIGASGLNTNAKPATHAPPTQVDTSANNPEPSATETGPDASTEPNPESQLDLSGYYVVRGPHWRKAFRNWAIRFDHNHLRITRILRCLRVLGLKAESDAFFTALQNVFSDPKIRINQRSMIFWHRAATRSLYIAPDDDRCAWLRNWEEEQGVFVDE